MNHCIHCVACQVRNDRNKEGLIIRLEGRACAQLQVAVDGLEKIYHREKQRNEIPLRRNS